MISGLGLVNPINKGTWTTASYYHKFDVVIYNNLAYICNISGLSKIIPTRAPSVWSIFPINDLPSDSNGPAVSLKGDQGLQGIQGPPGTQTVSVIAQIDLGSQRAITASGEYAGVKPAIGFTSQAVTLGMEAPVMTAGELNGFSGITSTNICGGSGWGDTGSGIGGYGAGASCFKRR